MLPTLLLSSCTKPVGQAMTAVGPVVSAPLPFPEAVLQAANAIFSSAPVVPTSPNGPSAANRQVVVIDPLVNGMASGEQSVATQSVGVRIEQLARQKYRNSRSNNSRQTRLASTLCGCSGHYTAYRRRRPGQRAIAKPFVFVDNVADLQKSRKGGSRRKWVQVAMDGINSTPVVFFRDSPAWTEDPQIKSYINSCRKPISKRFILDPVYVNGILTASIISDANDAYNSGRYVDALALYTTARGTATGSQLRVLSGLYFLFQLEARPSGNSRDRIRRTG